MLEARGLVKSFGVLKAVDGVSFTVEAGRIVGLLGPNGAGKTTTVSMLAGLLPPDAGEVLFGGRRLTGDSDPHKGQMGLVPQDLALYEDLSARENLRYFGSLQGMGRRTCDRATAQVLEQVSLADRAGDRVKTFSGGMKRRLNLAAGLLHDPGILLLDEPTAGVDPQSRNAIFEILEALRDRGKAILYTTHYMEEAERLCDPIIIMDHGQIIARDTLAGLQRLLPAGNRLLLELEAPLAPEMLEALRRQAGVRSASAEGHTVSVGLDALAEDAGAVLAFLSGRGIKVAHVASERAGLEEVFLTLTGRSLRDA